MDTFVYDADGLDCPLLQRERFMERTLGATAVVRFLASHVSKNESNPGCYENMRKVTHQQPTVRQLTSAQALSIHGLLPFDLNLRFQIGKVQLM